ncbi:SDR family oxidoreductase [Ruminococcus sp. OA3]|uniref:SDR family NAD(P)-dependent oxidoreductase n=1 Tax=Ruminococcus sp. OA3 TaxID=2914164 RepID=UPI001F06C8B8|nr:SDR family oxidoreductase [Ruminococcus sp. OA3]MCH1982394.1 SDR family oxidoreductase [Ruminococcus sp. OA3]
MMNCFQEKAAIVTGGTRGIGRAVAELLLGNGASVLITGRNEEAGNKAVEHLRGTYDAPVFFFKGDMGEESVCVNVADKAKELFGKVDYLVNNAFPFTAKYLDAKRSDWEHVMSAGPIAYATMIKEYVRVHGAKRPGAVVNVSSISQYIAQPHRWTYNTAKGAVGQLTKCAAMDLAPYIRVNSVSPAAVWTDECDRDHEDPFFERYHMIARVIESEEVAAPILFLLSDYASAITSTDLRVDGGYLSMGVEGWKVERPLKGSD